MDTVLKLLFESSSFPPIHQSQEKLNLYKLNFYVCVWVCVCVCVCVCVFSLTLSLSLSQPHCLFKENCLMMMSPLNNVYI